MKRHEVLASGILPGVAGGAAMLAVAMVGATLQELPVLHLLDVTGESLVRPGAFDGASTKLTFGALVHLGASIGWGILLAAIVPRDFPTASALGVGVGLALLALMFMMSLVVPWANPAFRSGMQDIGGSWVIAHAVYGLVLGMAPAFRRWFARDAARTDLPEPDRARQPLAPLGQEIRPP
jgi:hypothetical protein